MKKARNEQNKVTVSFEINEKIIDGFKKLCEDIGLPMKAVRKQEVKLSSLDVDGFKPK